MRLIDADNYCENICKCNRKACDKAKCPIYCYPTAFDLDKVIDNLKEEGCIVDDDAGNRAVEIIKAGGVHE